MYKNQLATDHCLNRILRLQAKNLKQSLSKEESISQGFLTVEHNLTLLQEMNHPHPHEVITFQNEVVAYALVMLKEMKNAIPILVALFEKVNELSYKGIPLRDAKYFIMGQICIDKVHRGKKLFSKLYDGLAQRMSHSFDYIITEISSYNLRSMRAHENYGFDLLLNYTADGEEWNIVIIDIKNR